MLRALRFPILVLLLFGIGATPALADKKKDIERAKELYQQGEAAQESGSYGEAATAYKAAYELIPEPLLLYNLGQVYRLDGKKRLAVDYYRRYLDADPKGRGAANAKKFIKRLSADLEKEDAAEKERQAKEAEQREKELAAQEEDDDKDNDEDEDDAGATEESGSPGAVLRWSGIGTAAVGAILVGVGIKYGLDAKSISDELSDNEEQWTPALLAKQDEGESAETKMFILTAVGSAAIIGGGVMYFFGHRADSEAAGLSFTPTTDGRRVGFALSGRF